MSSNLSVEEQRLLENAKKLIDQDRNLVAHSVYKDAKKKLLEEIQVIKDILLLCLGISTVVLGISVGSMYTSAEKFEEAIKEREESLEQTSQKLQAETLRLEDKIKAAQKRADEFKPSLKEELANYQIKFSKFEASNSSSKEALKAELSNARRNEKNLLDTYYQSKSQLSTSKESIDKLRDEQVANNKELAAKINELDELKDELKKEINQSLNKISDCYIFSVKEDDTKEKNFVIPYFNNLEIDMINPQGKGIISKLEVFDVNTSEELLNAPENVRKDGRTYILEPSDGRKYTFRILMIVDQDTDSEDSALFEICSDLQNS